MSTISTRRRGALRAAAVAGAVAVVVVGFDGVTYAATGSSLILGKSNSAGAATTITRTTPGPVLSLRTSTTASSPFSTNATGRVANLNADRVDGVSSEAFTLKSQNARAWQNPEPNSIVVPQDAQATMASLAFTAPADGLVLVTFSAEISAGSTNSYMYGQIGLDGTLQTAGFDWEPGDVDGFYDQQQQYTVLLPVTAGAHTVTAELGEYAATGPTSQLVGQRLTVLFVPAGGIVAPSVAPAATIQKQSGASANQR